MPPNRHPIARSDVDDSRSLADISHVPPRTAARASLLSGCALLPAILLATASPGAAQQSADLGEIAVTAEGQGRPVDSGTLSNDARPVSSAARDGGPVSLTRSSPIGLNLNTPSRSASRLGLTPMQTPANSEIISGEKARQRGASNVMEAVSQNATGIVAYGSPGNGIGVYSSRGFAGQNSVQQLFDGTRMNVAAGTVTFPFDLWNVERIEVLRGPASVLYGDGAIGGIVNVVSKQPLFTQMNVARVGFDTNGTARLALDSTGPLSDQVAYRLNISGNRTEGWLNQNSEFQNAAVSGAIKFQANPDLAFTVSHDTGYQEPMQYWGTPLINGRIYDAIRFNNYNVRNSKITYADNWSQFKTEWTPSENVVIRNTAYRLQSRRHWKEVEQYAFNRGTGQVDRFDYLEIYHQQEQIGNRFDASVKHDLFGMRNTISAGFDVNQINFRYTDNFNFSFDSSVPPTGFNPGLFPNSILATPSFKSNVDQASVFAEDRLELTEQWSVLAGVRFDAPTISRTSLRTGESFEKSYNALGYRFGSVYNFTPDYAVYGQYATATDPVTSLVTLSESSKNFKLATGEQIEAGLKGIAFGGGLEWTLAGYEIVKKNLISSVPGSTVQVTQVGQQSSRGAEFSVSMLLPANFRLDANVALLQAKYDKFNGVLNGQTVSFAGKQPINVPEQTANAWLNWAFAPGWEARVGVQYVGRTFADFGNTAPLPEYALLHAGLDWQVTPSSRLSVRGFNLTDKVYATDGGAANGIGYQWFLGRPRTVEVAYTVAW